MAKKMPRQIEQIERGDRLQFIRRTFDGRVWLAGGNGKECDVLLSGPILSLIAFAKPLRNIHNQVDGRLSSQRHGFKYTRWVSNYLLIDNCRRVETA